MFYGKYRELCALKGVSPSTAAVHAGISKSTVSVWKSKFDQGIDVDPDQQTIEKVCAYFKVSEAELRGFGDEGIKKDLPRMGEVSESKRKLLAAVDEMTDEQCDKMLELVLAAKKMF